MTPNTTRSSIPDAVATAIEDADEATLRGVVDAARSELAARRRDLLDVEPRPGEELVEVSDEPGYTKVVLRQPCAEGCEDCPHGPYLYHVRPERHRDDATSLHWTYVGEVVDETAVDETDADEEP